MSSAVQAGGVERSDPDEPIMPSKQNGASAFVDMLERQMKETKTKAAVSEEVVEVEAATGRDEATGGQYEMRREGASEHTFGSAISALTDDNLYARRGSREQRGDLAISALTENTRSCVLMDSMLGNSKIVLNDLVDDEDDDDDDSRSVNSKSTAASQRSIYSDKIAEASRRGIERAATKSPLSLDGGVGITSDHHGSSSSRRRSSNDSRVRRKKKKKKKKYSSRRERIRQIVESSAQRATANANEGRSIAEESNAANESMVDIDGSPVSLPTTSDLLSASDFTIGMYSSPHRKYNRLSSTGSSSTIGTEGDGNTLSSSIPNEKYHDKSYLADAASTKFHKGLQCVNRRRYALARSKFRAALKARILLHEDIQHLSIAPVHEMIGLVERKLGNFEKSRLHLLAALEICEGALSKMASEESEWLLSSTSTTKTPEEGVGKKDGSAVSSARDVALEGMEKLRVPDLKNEEVGESNGENQSDHANSTRQDQKRILVTNIERIKKTIEVVKDKEAGVGGAPTVSSVGGGMGVGGSPSNSHTDLGKIQERYSFERGDDDDSDVFGHGQSDQVAAAAVTLPISEDEKAKSWAKALSKEIGRPEVAFGSAEEVAAKVLQRQTTPEKGDVVGENIIDVNADDTPAELAGGGEDATEANEGRKVAWGLSSISEEKETSFNEHEDGAAHACLPDEIDTTALDRHTPSSAFSKPGPNNRLNPKTLRRLSTYDQDRLRETYHSQSEKGEDYYNQMQYPLAIASFNDARFALLIIAGLPEGQDQRDDPNAITYARLRDQINTVRMSFVVKNALRG